MEDYYSPVAEFYDIVCGSHPEGEDALRFILSDADSGAGPVLDIGAGAGRTVNIIAETLPEARILACEPSPAMRALLTHEVLASEDLKTRVTITAEPATEMSLPPRISALVLFGVIGHLDEGERRTLWDRVLPRLASGAPIAVELLPLTVPSRLPAMPLARETIGDRTYEGYLEGEPVDNSDIMRLTSTWRVTGGNDPERVIRNTSEWHTFGMDDLAEETGLPGEMLSDRCGVLRVPGGTLSATR